MTNNFKDASASSFSPGLVIVILAIVGSGFVCYKLGKKNGRDETEKEYKTRLEAILDRVNTILAEKESQF